jgi:hypothetical protein
MRRIPIALVFAFALALVPVWAQAPAKNKSTKATKTDAQISQEIIKSSVASYAGSCPCPYNTDRAGRSCGRRSAYSRPGGASPVCYSSDVTKPMIDDYRKHAER